MTLAASLFISILFSVLLAQAQWPSSSPAPFPTGGMVGGGMEGEGMEGEGMFLRKPPNSTPKIQVQNYDVGSARANSRKKKREEYLRASKVQVDSNIVCDEILKVKNPAIAGMNTSEDIENSMRCGKDYDPADWKKDTPAHSDSKFSFFTNNKNMKISLAQAKAYLLRFAKPGGFSVANDEHILLALAVDETVRTALKKELLFACQGALLAGWEGYSDYRKLELLGMEELLSIPPPSDTESCRSPAELEKVRKESFQWATKFTKHFDSSTGRSRRNLAPLYPFIPSITKLPEAQKNEIKGKMYRALATEAAEVYEGLFVSKAKLFTKSYVNKIFGDPSLEFSEFTAVGEPGGEVKYFLLGTSPMTSQGKNSYFDGYGIQSLKVYGPNAPLQEGHAIKPDVEWEHQGEKYNAQVKIETKKVKGLVPEGDKPDYDKMWDDQKLSGVVLVSSNLGESKAKVTEHYIQYYAEKGFDFSEPTSVGDTQDWLKKNISDGTVDYVLKDAHSGGNTTYLAAISKEHKLLKGTKTLANGKKEEVFILAPSGGDDDSSTDQNLAFDDMKKWMNQREQDKKGPLLYLNSSCSSLSQAKYEVPAIESPLFVNIPSSSVTTTFMNSPKSTKYHIMEGIRNGKSYAEIRSEMKTTKRYKQGDNQFKFPDEPSYQRTFTTLAEVQVAIKDSKGKSYNLEQAAH